MPPEPSRFSAKSVGRFLGVFQLVIEHGTKPKRICIDPTLLGITHITCIARLRDAALAIIKAKVCTPAINPATFETLWRQYEVLTMDDLVCAVPKTEKVTSPVVASAVVVGEDTADVLAVLNSDAEGFASIVSAFALLLGKRLLQGRVRIMGDFDTALQDQLMNQHDIVIVNEPDGWLMF